MLSRKCVIYMVCLTAVFMLPVRTNAQAKRYQMEIGLQGGCGYYVGDATTHIFNHVRETYGGHLRYKFDKRWSLQFKGLHHRIAGPISEDESAGLWQDKMINFDVVAEFNFFRFGIKEYDRRVKPITPYIFAGIGLGLYGLKYQTAAAYFPFGFGAKWKFADRWQLQLAWQHNLYFADDLEGVVEWGNTHDLNGSNIFNFDLTGQLMLSLVFEFAREKKVCPFCYDN